jgi:hypothetical protein
MKSNKVRLLNFALIFFVLSAFALGFNVINSRTKSINEPYTVAETEASPALPATAQATNPCPHGAASLGQYMPPKEGGIGSISNPTPAPTGTVSAPCKTVFVFFSKKPESDNNFAFTVPANRSTNRSDVAAFAIENLITGPTAQETSQGLFTPLKLNGDSNCGGKDFNINIDGSQKGTIKFCKNIQTAGVGDDARIKTTVEAALKQFSTITKVVILTKDDNCFGDQSGQNQCKN